MTTDDEWPKPWIDVIDRPPSPPGESSLFIAPSRWTELADGIRSYDGTLYVAETIGDHEMESSDSWMPFDEYVAQTAEALSAAAVAGEFHKTLGWDGDDVPLEEQVDALRPDDASGGDDGDATLYLTTIRCEECGNDTTFAHEGPSVPLDHDAPLPSCADACPKCRKPYPPDLGLAVAEVHEAEVVDPHEGGD